MKRKLIALVAALTMAISNVPALAASSDAIYVSANGSDSAAGTSASPVKTISKAINLAETKRAGSDDVTIIIQEGTYRFDSTVNITSAVSGTEGKSTIIKAEDGAEVVFKGSKELDVSKAEAVTDEAVLSRLYDNVRDKVVVIDLAAQGLTQADILDPSISSIHPINGNYALYGWEESWAENNAVYLNGAEQQLSRWPNNRDYAIWSNGSGATFSYSDDAPSRWASASGFWITSFAEYDYISSRMAVKSIDTSKKKITVIDDPVSKFTSDKSRRWAAFNLLEEIDIPGEYYIDRANMKLYMYAPENLASSTLEIDVLGTAMLNITEADNITFQGIDFAQTRSNAVFMKNVDNVDFIDCSFENIGVNGILSRGTVTAQTGKSHWEVQQLDGSYNVDISGCNFFNIGMGAIDITGGNVDTLTKSNNIIENCFINKTAQKCSAWEAISIRGCGTTVKNNNISNTPMQVIRPWGSLHTIEYNEIYDALHENDDCGMIYWGGNAVLRGTEVNYNYIHDAQAQYTLEDDKHSAIYWDDLQSGMSAQKNIFANIDGSSLFLNGAGAITHKYNTTVNSDKVLNLQNNAERLFSTVSNADAFTTLATAKSELANKELYYSTFEGLEDLLENGTTPLKYNKITNNFAYGTAAGNIESSYSSFSTVENNQNVSSGDYFVNPAAQDYRIKAAAKGSVNDYASLLNEENFNIESIGIQKDYSLNSETAGFDLVYPANGMLYDYTDGKIMLKWNAAPGANSYKVTVAKDKAFDAVVFTKETKATSQEVTGLEDTETYYWKVEAKNISRDLGATWTNNGGAYKFSYANITEFVAPAKPENMMTNPTSGDVFGNVTGLENIKKGYGEESDGIEEANKYNSYFLKAVNDTVAGKLYYGSLEGMVTTNGAGGLIGKSLIEGKNYVFSFLTRNAGTNDSANVNVALGNTKSWAGANFTEEKGTEGYTVTDREEWTKIAGTIVAPATTPYFVIGYPAGTPAGTSLEFNLAYKPEEAIYFAEEVLYDFNIESDKLQASVGDAVTLSAELLNQIGTDYSAAKELTWYAMDSEKKNVVDSITITPSADTKSATASFALDTQTGTYAIVAYSEANKVAKSVLIDVAGANEKYMDYTPGAKPENMMTNPTSGDVFGNVTGLENVAKGYGEESDGIDEENKYNSYFLKAVNDTVAGKAYYGEIEGMVTTNGVGGLNGKSLIEGNRYVFSFLTRNAGTTDSVNVNVALGNTKSWAGANFTEEKGTEGYTVTDREEWTKIAGTIVAPAAVPYFVIGYPAGTPAGTRLEFNLAYKPDEAIYFAEEAAYDIDTKRTSGEEVLAAGSEFTAEAKLLNQVGTAYTGEQTFTWYALNEGRAVEIPEIIITPSADTKTATVSVGSGIESGRYAIVAVSNEYEMAKGFEISVLSTAERFKDHVPGAKPENMMTNPTSGDVFGNVTGLENVAKGYGEESDGIDEANKYNSYFLKAVNDTVAGKLYYGSLEGLVTTNGAGGLKGKSLIEGNSYVFSFLTRNAGTTDSVNVNVGLGNTKSWSGANFTEEKGTEGYTVTDREEWTKVAGTIVAPAAVPYFVIGYPAGTPAGTGLEFNLAYKPDEAIYFAEEAAYDIELTKDANSVNILDTINLEANVLNQIGSKGRLSQNFTWYVLNADRTEEVDGFTVTSSGNTAQVVAGEDVATGDYTIVAVSDDYGFVKGVKVSVNGVKDIYKDTAPVSKPENMMTNPTSGDVFGNVTGLENVAKGYGEESDGIEEADKYNSYFLKAVNDTVAGKSYYGELEGLVTTNAVGGLNGKTLIEGNRYVFSFLTRNAGTTDSVNVNVGLGNTKSWSGANFTEENGGAGYTVTDREEWTKIAGTIVAPAATPYFVIGYPAGTPAGTRLEFNLAYKPEEAIYFAEEVAYDIEIGGSNAVCIGETATYTASVINQIGTEGSLSQDIDWLVVNEHRTQEAEGISISADGVLNVSKTAKPGKYIVIARSEDNGITKSFAVTVAPKSALYVDTIPGEKPENMMTNPTSGDVFGNVTGLENVKKGYGEESDGIEEADKYNSYFLKAVNDTVAGKSYYGELEGLVTTNGVGGLNGKSLNEGNSYVFSFLTRNAGTNDSVNVNVALGNTKSWSGANFTEEKGTEGYTVTDREEWTKIAGTIVAPAATPYFVIGYPAGTPAGTGLEFNLAYKPEEAIYFAEEVAYDIEVTSENPVVASNSTTEFEAKALNQIGSVGNLNQNFTWYVVSADRTEYVEGFTLTKSGNKVTVSVDDTVEAGTYTIVAVSDDYSLVKGIEITVEEPTYEVKDAILTVENGVAVAKVTTDVENSKVFLVVYNGSRLVGADMGVSGEELTLSGIASGNEVKVFAWNMQKLVPLTINPNYDMSLTVQ